jgi:hypothetical protein
MDITSKPYKPLLLCDKVLKKRTKEMGQKIPREWPSTVKMPMREWYFTTRPTSWVGYRDEKQRVSIEFLGHRREN